MKLTTTTQVCVDGVLQGNGPSEVDRGTGFERDGWTLRHFDDEAMMFVNQVYQRADAFLFGRRTYDIFAPYWGAMGPGSGPVADALSTNRIYMRRRGCTTSWWCRGRCCVMRWRCCGGRAFAGWGTARRVMA